MSKLKVSLVIITLNEEHNIERCIRSASWVDEVIILDSGSSDRTLEIAKALGARTFVQPFLGFREQKTKATSLAANDWILSLDADEALSADLSQALEAIVVKGVPDKFGYEFPRLSYYLGRWIRHGGWYPDFQLRFFNRCSASWEGGHVHERVGLNSKSSVVGRIDWPIHHWVFRDISHQVITNNNYSSKGALDLFDKGQRFSAFRLIVKPPFKFLECYLLKAGFKDGWAGFIIAISAAYSMFLKFAKLWELEKGRRS